MAMALRRAMASGLVSRSRVTAAGGGIVVCCEGWPLCVRRARPSRRAKFGSLRSCADEGRTGGVMGLMGGGGGGKVGVVDVDGFLDEGSV